MVNYRQVFNIWMAYWGWVDILGNKMNDKVVPLTSQQLIEYKDERNGYSFCDNTQHISPGIVIGSLSHFYSDQPIQENGK